MINNIDYKLDSKNHCEDKHQKSQILLMDTHTKGMEHVDNWKKSLYVARKYLYTTPYTITASGEIYEHYDPEFISHIFGLDYVDKKIIGISLENMGWVEYNHKKNGFINWSGDIYGTEEDVYIKGWRGQMYWAKYTEKQVESLIYLLHKLCFRYDIPKKIKENNTQTEFVENFLGVAYKSNYSKMCTDINPSMNFKYLKEKLEL
jgi:N-acetyl-anhydromuramyl-L-alanine amidase AmpD